MSYKEMQRRLADLEREAAAKQQAWLESLSDAELDALLEEQWPGFVAAFAAMSEADQERWYDGKMPEAEWQQHLQRAQEGINAPT